MELINAGCYMSYGTFLAYVLKSIEEYQTMILALKHKVRKGTLTIEETENLLDDKFEAAIMKQSCSCAG